MILINYITWNVNKKNSSITNENSRYGEGKGEEKQAKPLFSFVM